MFRLSHYGVSTNISEYQVANETDKFIIYVNSQGKEVREQMVSNYHSWHNTNQEAIYYRVKDLQLRIKNHKQSIQSLEFEINSLKSK